MRGLLFFLLHHVIPVERVNLVWNERGVAIIIILKVIAFNIHWSGGPNNRSCGFLNIVFRFFHHG